MRVNRLTFLRVGMLGSLLAAAVSSAVFAQPAPTSNYTSFEATSAAPVQIGYYAAAHNNCTPAPLPTIRVIEPPKSGALVVRRGELTINTMPGCPGLKIPAQVAFYHARAGATGTDHLVYQVTNPNGEVGTYDVTITIKNPPDPNEPPKGTRI
jgi:hypothetical protein